MVRRLAALGVGVALMGSAVLVQRERGPATASVRPPTTAATAVTARPARARPAVAPRPPTPSAFVVGDSLTVGSEPWLDRALLDRGWDLSGVDARVGRGVDEGLTVLRKQSGTLPGTVVVALGTNNLNAGSDTVRRWLRAARDIVGTRRLVWVNTCLDDSPAARYRASQRVNAALDRYAGRYGVEVADWCAYAAARDITTVRDGVHYSAAAYRVRARFYALALAKPAAASGTAAAQPPAGTARTVTQQ